MAERNANVPNINRAVIDEHQNLEALHQEINFDYEGELLDINIQEVQVFENVERTLAENMRSRLLYVHAMCTDCDTQLSSFLRRLHAEIRGCIQLRNRTRAILLQETLSYWQPFYAVLRNIMSEIESLLVRVIDSADVLDGRIDNAVWTLCDNLEDNVHTLIRFMLEI